MLQCAVKQCCATVSMERYVSWRGGRSPFDSRFANDGGVSFRNGTSDDRLEPLVRERAHVFSRNRNSAVNRTNHTFRWNRQ